MTFYFDIWRFELITVSDFVSVIKLLNMVRPLPMMLSS